jgi:hypothetical protein
MLRFVKLCGLATTAALAAAIVGCASTSYVSSWQAPVEGQIQFDNKRVAAIVVHADESTRRAGETALAREISARGAQGVPSYTIIPGESAKDQAGAKKKLEEAKIEGAVIMRVVSNEQEISYSPGTGWYGALLIRLFLRLLGWLEWPTTRLPPNRSGGDGGNPRASVVHFALGRQEQDDESFQHPEVHQRP